MSVPTKKKLATLVCAAIFLLTQLVPASAVDANLTGRFFMIVWSFQGPDDDLVHAHTFVSFYRGDDLEKGIVRPETISWLPATGKVQPFGAEEGRNFSLDETLRMACRARRQVRSWGPYEIRAELFERAQKRLALLQSGHIRYSMISTPPQSMNCIAAAGDLTPAPLNSGILWGAAASAKVAEHLSPYIVRKEYGLKDLITSAQSDACPGRGTELSHGTTTKSIHQSIAAALGH